MEAGKPLARGDILARTGLPADVLTFWVRRGLVRPIDEDREVGKHRRFAFYEANIAALMAGLRGYGLDIEALLSIAAIYREAVAWAHARGLGYDDAVAICRLQSATLRRAVLASPGAVDTGEMLADVASLKDRVQGRFQLTDELIAIASDAAADGTLVNALAYTEIIAQPLNDIVPHTTYFWKVGDTWKRSIHRIEPLRDDAFIQIAVNTSSLFYRVWNRP